MAKIDKHIEIVRSDETGLSSISRASVASMLPVLSKHYKKVGVTVINNLEDLGVLVASKPDLVFLGVRYLPVHYELGFTDVERIWISDYLDEHEIAYTGSGRRAHQLEIDKSLSKQCAMNAGLKTSPYFVIDRHQTRDEVDSPLTFPVFIKPTSRGGGLGINSKSLVQNHDQLWAKVYSLASLLDSDSLVEDYLSGREFSVSIFKKFMGSGYSVMPIELIAPLDKNGSRILSGKVKESDTETRSEVKDQKLKAVINTLALDVFTLIGARDFGRIDIRLDRSGQPNFLEANLMPSLTENFGSFPKSCLINEGLTHEAMILNIINLAFARSMQPIEETAHSANMVPEMTAVI